MVRFLRVFLSLSDCLAPAAAMPCKRGGASKASLTVLQEACMGIAMETKMVICKE